MENQIIISDISMEQSVEKILQQLNAITYHAAWREAVGDSFMENIEKWARLIGEQRKEPFTLVFVGDFKRGKSMLINALCGEEVVPVDVTPETMTLNRISYGVHRNEGILDKGRRVVLEDGDLRRDRLRALNRELKTDIRQIELSRPLEILQHMTIIDTPGLGEQAKEFDDLVLDALLRADAVVYVYNSRFPLSQTEQMFLKTAVLPQQYTSLFLVGNFADTLLTRDSYLHTRELLADRVHGLLPEGDVILLSALDEMCRITGQERPCEGLQEQLAAEFDYFRQALQLLVEKRRDTVLPDRMQRLVAGMLASVNTDLDAMLLGIRMSAEEGETVRRSMQEKKQQAVAERSAQMDAIRERVGDMQAETVMWMREFLCRMEEETRSLVDTDIDTLMKYYSVYCVDMLQQALNLCLDHHRSRIFTDILTISERAAQDFAAGSQEKNEYRFGMNVHNRIWTKGDTAGMAVSCAQYTGLFSGVFAVAGTVVDMLTGFARDREKQNRTGDVIKQILSQFAALHGSLEEAVRENYQKLADRAAAVLGAFCQAELEETERTVEQTCRVARMEEESKQETAERMQEIKDIFLRIEREMA